MLTEFRYDLRCAWKRFRAMCVPLLAAAVTSVLFTSPSNVPLTALHLRTLTELRGVQAPSSEVVLISIDDESRVALGLTPQTSIPRAVLADTLERTAAAKPAVMIVDFALTKQVRDPAANDRIARALAAVPSTLWSGDMASRSSVVFGSDEQFTRASKLVLSMAFPIHGDTIFYSASTREPMPSVGQAINSLTSRRVAAPPASGLINFYGPPGTIPHIPISQLLAMSNAQLETALRDKIAIVGNHNGAEQFSGVLGSDQYRVSGSWTPMFGAEIHATIANNLLDHSWITMHAGAALQGIAMIAAFLIVRGLTGIPPVRAFLALTGLAALTLVGSYFLFVNLRVFTPLVLPALLGSLLALMIGVAVQHRAFAMRIVLVAMRTGLRVFGASDSAAPRGMRRTGQRALVSTALVLILLPLQTQVSDDFATVRIVSRLNAEFPNLTPAPVTQVVITDQTLKRLAVSPGAVFPSDVLLSIAEGIAALKPGLLVIDLGFPKDGAHDAANAQRLKALLGSVDVVIWDGVIPDPTTKRRVSDPTRSALLNTDAEVVAQARGIVDLSFATTLGSALSLESIAGEWNFDGEAEETPQVEVLRSLSRSLRQQLIHAYPQDQIMKVDGADVVEGIDSERDDAEVRRAITDRVVVLGFASSQRQVGSIRIPTVHLVGQRAAVFASDVTATRVANLLTNSGVRVLESALITALAGILSLAIVSVTLWAPTRAWVALPSTALALITILTIFLYAQLTVWVPALYQTGVVCGVALFIAVCLRRDGLVKKLRSISRIFRFQIGAE